MRYYRPFRDVIPHSKAGHPRVTHPFATLLIPCGTFAFDLHVLGTPPALILSQDQTLMLKALSRLLLRQDFPSDARGREATCLTRGRFIGSALFNPSYVSWFSASRLRTD